MTKSEWIQVKGRLSLCEKSFKGNSQERSTAILQAVNTVKGNREVLDLLLEGQTNGLMVADILTDFAREPRFAKELDSLLEKIDLTISQLP